MAKKRVFIIPGLGATPADNWFPWLKEEFLKLGIETVVPAMPNIQKPEQLEWLAHLSKIIGKPDSQTFLIGHSLGSTLILRYLENLSVGQKVGGAILVAGPISSVGLYEIENFFKKEFDFKKIKQAAKKIVLIYSDNDPLVPKSHGEKLQEKLGGKLYLIPRGNHLCEGDGFFRFPIALKEILEIE